ncbi:HlyD family type I secretion periplasmic adaptor subunit [Marinobacterium sediminicola]|uniref:Membrane fusion protein (MFP) family protein n=1 Tax=Marinobacterium sediminicola TaxID=518898 RepID=A0ABY1RXS8_9GAMM|nr:HlyD family type I secretion periplasmic adaptor subunit [Marinobacterium sediminicola]ULG68591.1 HlyD family type I secretion periplasmic adaptor subunit [Marinobacterium sediminicola]SMR73109.1 membrane fusion protein, adhesin transport system [Marinobacterium sediminicola]
MGRNHTPRRGDIQYTNSISEAMLEQAPKGASLLLWSGALFIALALIWANWAELDEIARGEGEIIPSHQLQIVQNLEGGIVSEILVREGQLVERGEVLLRIEDKRFASSFRENQIRELELKARAVRLTAEANDEPFSMPTDFGTEHRNLIEQELRLFESRQKELISNLEVLAKQRQQREQELVEANSRIDQLKRSYALLLRELRISEPLVREGVISEVEHLRLRRQVNDLSGEISSIELSVPRIEAAISEIEQRQEDMELQFRNRARAELNELVAEQVRLEQALSGMQDRISRTEVRAPIRGTVKQLMINTIDGVVKPGDPLLSIVPFEDKLLVEARIKPSDIANIRQGQDAVVKVSAYDFAIYGGLDAKVVFISPGTIMDPEAKLPYYLVRLETEAPYLGTESEPLPLMAGMTVGVDILTGKKSVMHYLLKPINRATERALTER